MANPNPDAARNSPATATARAAPMASAIWPGQDHENDGADRSGRDDQAGKRLVPTTLAHQHRDEKGHAIGDRKKKPSDTQDGKLAAIDLLRCH